MKHWDVFLRANIVKDKWRPVLEIQRVDGNVAIRQQHLHIVTGDKNIVKLNIRIGIDGKQPFDESILVQE